MLELTELKLFKKYISNSEEETINYAYKFASVLKANDIIVLSGDLGTGKTRFMYGIAKFFQIENKVSSPTFTIVNEYSNIPKNTNSINDIFHFDVYRLTDSNDFETTIGLDYFNRPNTLCILEWGEIISDILPNNTIYVQLESTATNTRSISIYIKKGGVKHEI